MPARAAFFLGLAVLAVIFFEAAFAPEEGEMPAYWAERAVDSAASHRARAEALYRLGLHRERFGDYDGAMEAYERLLTEVPYVPTETAAIDWGFRQDEARLRHREILARAARGEIELKRSWPAR